MEEGIVVGFFAVVDGIVVSSKGNGRIMTKQCDTYLSILPCIAVNCYLYGYTIIHLITLFRNEILELASFVCFLLLPVIVYLPCAVNLLSRHLLYLG